MDDSVFNAMTSFQFFCNDFFKKKNIDKLMPKGMLYSDWHTSKEEILSNEIESVNHYLGEQALLRLQSYTASVNKEDIERRFNDIITRAMDNYKVKIKDYYRW
jgi:hypothetical protein